MATSPGPDHQRLGIFVGRWRTTGTIAGKTSGPDETFEATDVYQWLPGGYFLEHGVEGRMSGHEVRTLEVIGVDLAGGYFTHSYDNAGNAANYSAALAGNRWTIKGEAEQFAGTFTEDANRLSGRWTRLEDGHWVPWLDITLTRVG